MVLQRLVPGLDACGALRGHLGECVEAEVARLWRHAGGGGLRRTCHRCDRSRFSAPSTAQSNVTPGGLDTHAMRCLLSALVNAVEHELRDCFWNLIVDCDHDVPDAALGHEPWSSSLR